jgi:hypothetical protein
LQDRDAHPAGLFDTPGHSQARHYHSLCAQKIWLTLPVADQIFEKVEYLWRDGDDVSPALQLRRSVSKE